MKRRPGALLALACCLVVCIALAACGTQQLSREQLVEQKDAWAEDVLRSALDDLAKQGAIDSVSKDAKLLDDAFEYDGVEGDYDIVYKDSQVKSELTGSFSLPDGKVMICDPDYNGKMRVFYQDGKSNTDGFSVPEDAPLFYPASLNGYFSSEGLESLLDGVELSRFADNFDDCDYLIAFDGVHTHVDEDFYFGSINRTSCTTFAVIVDAKTKKVLHIENLGTNTPANQVKTGQEVGQVRYDELIAYLNGLLK